MTRAYVISDQNTLFDQLKIWLIQAQEGNRTSYESFLQTLSPYIKGVLRRKLGPVVDVEDLSQECLIGIHQNLASFHPSRPLKPWISAIIRYKVADHFRALAKKTELSLPEIDLLVTNFDPLTNEQSQARDSKDVMEWLQKLPDPLKRCLVLTKLEGHSYQEVAQQEGLTEAALRKRISRAYQELKKIIEAESEDPFYEP